jgi:phage terminase large subunit-like protein
VKKKTTPSKRCSATKSPAKRPATKRRRPPRTPKEGVEYYIDDVLSGRRVVGKLERWAVERHVRDLKRQKKKGWRFDEDLATRACNFFLLLKHTSGEWKGKPFELKSVQLFIVWCLCGWRIAATGYRRFHMALISMARGNGKTAFAAGLTILLFGFDSPIEWRAEAYTTCCDKALARRCFDDIQATIEANPGLAKHFKIFANAITMPRIGASLKPLSGLGKNKDSLRPHVIVCDELHAWREEHKDLWEKLTSALGKNRQPLFMIISTAGDEESELWDQQFDLAASIVDPDCALEIDNYFVFICQLDEDDDPFQEANWPKANPLLADGLVKIDFLRNEAKTAQHQAESKNKFLRYYCNRKVTSETKPITAELWARGNRPLPELINRECHGGFDWGWKDDLASLALVFPLQAVDVGGGEYRHEYAALVDAWIPEGTKRNLAAEPWATWINDGLLRVTHGNTTDTASIYARLAELQKLYGIKTIAMDGNNAREFGSRITTDFGIEAYYFGQVHGKYNEPFRELLTALRQDRIRHGGNPLLAWSATNVMASVDSRDYIKPEKKRSKDKIDPFCALVMGLSECLYTPLEGPSIYEQPGNLVL